MAKASVKSIDSLRRFRIALQKFEEEASSALDSIKFRSERADFWLRNDQYKHWKIEEKKWDSKMQQAKMAYNSSKMGGKQGNLADKSDMRRAQERRDHARDKIEKIRKWVNKLDQELQRESATCIRLSTLLRNRCPDAKYYMTKLIEHLEKYQTDASSSIHDTPAFCPEDSEPSTTEEDKNS